MRDAEGNTITICNMENFDPLGIHTGDSIVVCPSQTLSDDEYQILRNGALNIVDACGIVGECNVQYSLDPESHQYYVIEVNARLSRSSALASKASGYPIAFVAAKVVLGYDLLELKNPVTGITFAYFEPALDYVTIKVPRWDLTKFRGASRSLGSTMKSVGEIMSIGRSFQEAIQKSMRMVTEIGEGLSSTTLYKGASDDELESALNQPTDQRFYAVIDALRRDWDIEKIHSLTRIDKWFLAKLRDVTLLEKEIGSLPGSGKDANEICRSAVSKIDEEKWRRYKNAGFADEQMAGLILQAQGRRPSESELLGASLEIRKSRLEYGVKPVVKKIDTTAGEYPSPSNYLYMSYGGLFDDPLPDDGKKSALVLGGGAYRIGTSVEFDWCAVSCSNQLRRGGWRSVIINCNPETVSTDYNSSDRLFFIPSAEGPKNMNTDKSP